MKETTRILLAEDEEIIAIIIQDILDSQHFEVTVCADGQSAWECLQNDQAGFDVILLDQGLPKVDGMELLRRIKNDPVLVHVPVIIETARGDIENIHESLKLGAYYYLIKPFQAEVLLAVVNAALEQRRGLYQMLENMREVACPLVLMHTGSFRFQDLEQGRLLANYLARICPEPERAMQSLQELLVNAVEHGNLEISYADKSALILNGSWQEEVERRLQLPEYRDRYVEVRFLRRPDLLIFTIQDQGQGFNWKEYLDFSPERAFDLHGRGIAIARKLSFEQLQYQGNGSTVSITFACDFGSTPARRWLTN